MGKIWSREDIIVAYALYCITPLKDIRLKNKVIQQIAQKRGLSPSSLVLRMQNFRYLDPAVNKEKQTGLGHVAKKDKEIFSEFKNDWGNLSASAEKITKLNLFDSAPDKGARPISSLTEKNKVSRERAFFRKSVLAAYENQCCISGLSISNLLTASHIKPYNKCRASSERTNPENGLCLNSFYDKAFDFGLFTVGPNYIIHVSQIVKNTKDDFTQTWLTRLEGTTILKPVRFQPDKEYLQYHNDVVFRR